MSNDFFDLVKQLRCAGCSRNSSFLHGLLTGFATSPEPDFGAFWAEVGVDMAASEDLSMAVYEFMDALQENLSVYEFKAELGQGNVDYRQWIEGYFRAVELHEAQWQEFNNEHPNSAMTLVILRSFADAELRQSLNIQSSADEELSETPSIISELAVAIYDHLYMDLDEEFGDSDIDDFIIPSFPADQLQNFDEQALFAMPEDRGDYSPSLIETHVREQPKTGRNDPCPCGSGKKYKKCCLH